MVGWLIFVILCSGEVQPWAKVDSDKNITKQVTVELLPREKKKDNTTSVTEQDELRVES